MAKTLDDVTQLDFDAVEKAQPTAKAITDWPLWVQVGAAWVEMALKTVGITVDINPEHPDEYLHKLIKLVESSPSLGYGKFLALAALRWIHTHMHADQKTFAKFAKYGSKGLK